jgi:hypothetical protein
MRWVLAAFLALHGCQRSDQLPVPTYNVLDFQLGRGDTAELIHAAVVTPAFFPETKARPLLGRLFLDREYERGQARTVVVGNKFWQRKLKGDPASIGQTMQLSGENFTIVGVMPAAFQIPAGADVWIPRAAAY